MKCTRCGALVALPMFALLAGGCTVPAEIGPAWLADFRDKNVLAGIPIHIDPADPATRKELDRSVTDRAVADGRVARATWIEPKPGVDQESANSNDAAWESQGLDLDGVRGGDLKRVLILGDPHRPVIVIAEPADAGPDDLVGQAALLGLRMGKPAYVSTRFGTLHQTQIADVYLVVREAEAGGSPRVAGVARFCRPFEQSHEFHDWIDPAEHLAKDIERATTTICAYQGLSDLGARQDLRRLFEAAPRLGVADADQLIASAKARLLREFVPELDRAVEGATAAGTTIDARLTAASAAARIAILLTEVWDRMPERELALVRRCMGAFADAGEAWAKVARDEGRPAQAAVFARLAAAAQLHPMAPPSAAALYRFLDLDRTETLDMRLAQAEDSIPPGMGLLDRQWAAVDVVITFARNIDDDVFESGRSELVSQVLERVRQSVIALADAGAAAEQRATAEGHPERAAALESLVAAIRLDADAPLGKPKLQAILAEKWPTDFDLLLAEATERATKEGSTTLDRGAAAGDAVTVAIEFDGVPGRMPLRLRERVQGCVQAFADACAGEAKDMADSQPAEATAFQALAAAAQFDATAAPGKQAMETLRNKLRQARNVIPLIHAWPSTSFVSRLDAYAELAAAERNLGQLGSLLAKYRADILPAAREQAEIATKDGRLATAAGCRLIVESFSGGSAATAKEAFGAVLVRGLDASAGNLLRAQHAIATLFARLVPVPDPAACTRMDALVAAFEGGGMLHDHWAATLLGLEVGSLPAAAVTLTQLGRSLGRFEVTELEGNIQETRNSYTAPVHRTERQVVDNSAARDARNAELAELKQQIDAMAGSMLDAANLANGHRNDALLARVAATTQTREFGELGYGQDMWSRAQLYRDRLEQARNQLIDRYNDMLATRPLATSEHIVEHEQLRTFDSVLFTAALARRLNFTGERGSGSQRQTFDLATGTMTPEEIRTAAQRKFEAELTAAATSLFARLLADQLDGYVAECSQKGGEWAVEARWARCLLGDSEHRDPAFSELLEAARSPERR